MKTLTLFLSLTLVQAAPAIACVLTLKVTSINANTGKVNDVNFGRKQLDVLRSLGCKITKSPMTKQELKDLAKKQFEAKLARIEKKK